MIHNQDRSGWFGASDTAIIMGSWDTDSFRDWWAIKTGLPLHTFKSRAMDVGNAMEHAIIDAICAAEKQRIRKGNRPVYRRHRLRVNYDGLRLCEVVEVKTSGKGFSKVPRGYWMQCQVLMYALRRRKCSLWLYVLNDDEYDMPYFAEADAGRLRRFEIPYDAEWIKREYLPRLRVLARCLKKGVWPCADDIRRCA